MVLKIEQDASRFREIVRGRIRKDLRRYITSGELIGRQGKHLISIPVPQVRLPHFEFGQQSAGGTGQGEGEVGQAMGPGEGEPGSGPGAGNMPGEHVLEVDVTIEELAKILGEELELPNIKPRGRKNVKTLSDKYLGVSRTGPESLRYFKRTYRQALKRQIASGTYDPDRPLVVPIKDDKRYRTWKQVYAPQNNAVILYIMDVSGSMGDEQKEIVRIESFWIDTWLRYQYKGIESRFIVHDAAAKEVDRETFFRIRESGGTAISSAYKLSVKILEEEYPVDEWNTYIFHFSDGDNWSVDDTQECIRLLKENLLGRVNLFCYGQVDSPYGSGQFLRDIGREVEAENLVTSHIENKDAIYESIKEFLGKGR